MTHLAIRNLEHYQHYKKRRPPWVKLYQTTLEDLDFIRLQDASKWLALGLLLVASRYDNLIPNDPELLAKILHTTEPIDLQPLIDMRYLVVVGRVSKSKDASIVLAERKQDVSHLVQRTENREQRERTTSADAVVGKAAVSKVPHWAQPLADAWEAKYGKGSWVWKKHVRALAALDPADVGALAAGLARYLDETEPRYANLPGFLEKRASWIAPKVDPFYTYLDAHGPMEDPITGELTECGELLTSPFRRKDRERLGIFL